MKHLALFASLALLATAACNAEVDGASHASSNQAALTAKYVGSYTASSDGGIYSFLELRGDHGYAAVRRVAGGARPESGSWFVTTTPSSDSLTLEHDGTRETHPVAKTGEGMSVGGPGGSAPYSPASTGKACTSQAQCGANEACEASPCLMACPPNDLSCCGGGHCVAKKPEGASCSVDAECPSGTVCSTPPCLLVCTAQDPDCCGPKACVPGSR